MVHKKKTGENSHNGIVGHGFPNKIDDMQKKALENLNRKYFSEFATAFANQFLYRELLHGYLKEASRAQITSEAAINFHKAKVYSEVQRLTPDKSGGQMPSAIIIAGTSEDHTFEIFSYNASSDEKRCWKDGAFGAAINIRKEKHMNHNGFFESSAYMVNHMKHEKTAVPYMLFVCDYGSKDEREGNAVEKEIGAMEEVRKRSIGEWRKTGHFIIEEPGKVPYLYTSAGGKEVRIYMPVVLHDLKKCEYYVCEEGERIPFSSWAGSAGLHNDPRVQNHLEAMLMHKDEKPYFDDLVNLNRGRKKSCCVDSREEEQQGSAIRLMGGIATEEQRMRILEGLESFTVSLHFGCGYLTTAMGVHEMGREIMQMLRSGEEHGKAHEAAVAREHLKGAIVSIIEGKFAGFDVDGFITMLEGISGRAMGKSARKTLSSVLGGETSEIREIAKHMYNRGILAWSEASGTVVMPSAEVMDSKEETQAYLPENRSKKEEIAKRQRTIYYDKITLQVAREETDKWQSALIKTGSGCGVKVQVKNYKNAVVLSAMPDGRVIDAITGRDAGSETAATNSKEI